MTTIGFIGLGIMGKPMVNNLVAAGFDVIGFDANNEVLSALAQELGITPAQSAADFSNAEAVVTMLPNSNIVRSALFDWDSGIVDALPEGAVIIDMSSSSPVATIALAEEVAIRGKALVDAPVSGALPKAITGELTIMLGGVGEAGGAIDTKVRQVLAPMSKAIIPTGAVGTGHAMKALNNVVAGAATMACFEALAAGKQFGLAPETMVEVWNQSTGKSFVTENVIPHTVIPETYDSGFKLSLYTKDVNVAGDVTRATGVATPVIDTVVESFNAASAALGDVDHTMAAVFVESRQIDDNK